MRIGRVAAVVVGAALVAVPTAAALSEHAHSTGAPPALAFVRDTASSSASAWVAGSDGGSPRKLGGGSTALISPNGRFVASSSAAEMEPALTVFDTAGGPRHAFFGVTNVSAWPIAWSHDSRYLAVELSGTTGAGLAGSKLELIDTATMTATSVASGDVYGASFAPAKLTKAADELVYGLTHSERLNAKVNLYTAIPNVAGSKQLTHNGISLEPLWTRRGIVFDRERRRSKEGYPAYQLWLKHGSQLTQLTHMRISQLVSGLIPIAASSSGNRLEAAYVGEDTDYAWRVQISPRRVGAIQINHQLVQEGGISRNGKRLLVDHGAFMAPADRGTVEWVPFFGGKPHKLARGGFPSWNS